ncbi:MAG: Asp-tRNA(Asn)/Glu-tRNA(Gln) amidotransferase subunit GatB [Chloroflexi bacterium]|nr:Asp-tRNA(Asn)/Glu-tRNA(Gln) amidotransferase subunit GatB [Chloroflexota bacterium]MBP7045608.1 Asp-tRNA(Asn)/Glu-tRNA(Gln) amidotransferase subunit GatB [Chloroflexota bacterium]
MTNPTTPYEPIIGLEIHAELMTNSKMFCPCQVVDSVEAEPNTAVCPVCLGMPGMLPVINRRAVEYAMRVALALNCEVQQHNIFARKNYFYPDLPKAYQLTQYELPIGLRGWLDIELEDGSTKRIRVRRVHMEEDTGKLTHLDRTAVAAEEGTLVDYNRSGVPLLEIVSEPDIHSGEEARAYAMKIRQILRYLGVNAGDLEKGVFRVEPNISIRPIGQKEFGRRTELKNLNSFKSLADGTAFEIERQTAVLNSGGQVVQETRGWHDTKRITFSQRSKEEAEDYRYFPEPDLPPLSISDAWIAEVRASLPELPDAKVQRYQMAYGLSAYDARVLTEEKAVAAWFETAVSTPTSPDPKTLANWIINNLFSLMNEHKQNIDQIAVTPAGLAELLELVERRTINNNTAKEVLAAMFTSGQSAPAIVQAQGLAQVSDEGAITAVIERTLDADPGNVAAYLSGKEKLIGFFVGQVMREMRGKGDPAVVNRLLAAALAKRKP